MATRSYTPNPRDAEVIANATAYVVCGFRGRAEFTKERHTTLTSARDGARAMANALHRPVAVYAIMPGPGMEREAHLENVEPTN